MTPTPPTRPLHLFKLSPLQRRLVVHLTRTGPAAAQALAQSLGHGLAEIEEVVLGLVEQGSLRLRPDGLVEAVWGPTRRRTLPPRLALALSASGRLFSAQEIAILRTVTPILHFARARLSEFADHGPNHALRVKAFAIQLGYLLGLTPTEQHLLRAAALFHDVGNVVDRARHHLISQETVERLAASGALPLSRREAELVGLLCRWHRKEYEPARCDEQNGDLIRTGLLASILRVADAMDIDQRRSDYGERFAAVLQFFYPHELPYWTSLEEILGVRICCTPSLQLQVFTSPNVTENLQIAMLRGDLATTPLDWSVQPITVASHAPAASANHRTPGAALLAFPFDPHSLVMAALSRQNLVKAGYMVTLLCYADTAEGATWLWQQALPASDGSSGSEFTQRIIINDRPDPALHPQILTLVQGWQAAAPDGGPVVTFLNRHEANWTRAPALLRQGAGITLGGDWAYFWGDRVTPAVLSWARIAAFCTRDPTQATVQLSEEEELLHRELLNAVYTVLQQANATGSDWTALAEPLLDRIGGDDRAWFSGQADAFTGAYATLPRPVRVAGRVLLYDEAAVSAPAEHLPQSYFWALEAAIERQGRLPGRGIEFKAPYAIATWPTDDGVELLALNHWRAENAIPIRLLYPDDLGPAPQGNEYTIQVRLTADQAERVVNALVAAANQSW